MPYSPFPHRMMDALGHQGVDHGLDFLHLHFASQYPGVVGGCTESHIKINLLSRPLCCKSLAQGF